MTAPSLLWSSTTGSANAPVTPNFASDGPSARTMTFFDAEPVIMKPPMARLSPVSTRTRVETLRKPAGEGVAVAEGVGLGPPGAFLSVIVPAALNGLDHFGSV